jgi:hypothetical protein
MINQLNARRVVAALCVAALLSLASASIRAQNRMNPKSVGVTSNGPSSNVEAIRFEGQAVVNSRLASDPDFGNPTMIMLFDLSGVTGTGVQSGTKYVITSQEHIIRPLVANHNIEFTFPMATDENSPIDRVRVGSARFVMNVDISTGAITSLNSVLTPR